MLAKVGDVASISLCSLHKYPCIFKTNVSSYGSMAAHVFMKHSVCIKLQVHVSGHAFTELKAKKTMRI